MEEKGRTAQRSDINLPNRIPTVDFDFLQVRQFYNRREDLSHDLRRYPLRDLLKPERLDVLRQLRINLKRSNVGGGASKRRPKQRLANPAELL
jgi:hypothetical protein